MRLFISIDLPKEVKDYLFDLQKSLRDLGKINWVAKKNLHLTLKFFGEINEKQLIEIKNILKDIKFNKFTVGLKGAGIFPNKNIIRIFWVGLEPVNELINLQKKIDEELLLKFSKDQKFLAHLTLGRVKQIKEKKKFFEDLDKLKIKEMNFEINHFDLVKSELKKEGPQYIVLEKYDLV